MSIELLTAIGTMQLAGVILLEVFVFTRRRASASRVRPLTSVYYGPGPASAMPADASPPDHRLAA